MDNGPSGNAGLAPVDPAMQAQVSFGTRVGPHLIRAFNEQTGEHLATYSAQYFLAQQSHAPLNKPEDLLFYTLFMFPDFLPQYQHRQLVYDTICSALRNDPGTFA